MTDIRDSLAQVQELKPCPFCGGEAHLERTGHVACKTNWPCVHTAFFNSGTPAEQNAAAIAAWNHRHSGGDGEAWRGIETCPNADRVVMFCDERKNIWTDCAWDRSAAATGFCATHWRPLPEPPSEDAALRDDADAALALLSRMRFACGDNGLRMQDELEEYLRGLARDAARYRWLRDASSGAGPGVFDCNRGGYPLTWLDDDALDAAIDAARAGERGGL